jgi:hypothetical protein
MDGGRTRGYSCRSGRRLKRESNGCVSEGNGECEWLDRHAVRAMVGRGVAARATVARCNLGAIGRANDERAQKVVDRRCGDRRRKQPSRQHIAHKSNDRNPAQDALMSPNPHHAREARCQVRIGQSASGVARSAAALRPHRRRCLGSTRGACRRSQAPPHHAKSTPKVLGLPPREPDTDPTHRRH